MNRVEQIRKNPGFRKCMDEINQFETERIYCGHDFGHLLEVARIAYILNLEEGSEIPKELIYAAALLHDVGRVEQYKSNKPHNEAGAEIARTILRDCDFTNDEISMIVEAIRNHRGCAAEYEKNGSLLSKALLLSKHIRRADKASRPCYACGAASSCDWADDKKNSRIIF